MSGLSKRFFLAVALSAAATAALAAREVHESNERGVTVTVTPLNVEPGAKVWEFRVALETHEQELADDLVATSVLLADGGAKRHAIAWEGPGPGGHHRSGVLKFEAIHPWPRLIELLIWRDGEAGPRAFRWTLK